MPKPEPQYDCLVPGDVRQAGDESKHRFGGYQKSGHWPGFNSLAQKDWEPISPSMIGQPILPSDLIQSTYRRPKC